MKNNLLDTYIRLLKTHKKQSETLLKLILSIVQHKVAGSKEEKHTFIQTIKRIDLMNEPEKLRKFVEEALNEPRVRVFDVYQESCLGWKNYKFSKEFKQGLRAILYK